MPDEISPCPTSSAITKRLLGWDPNGTGLVGLGSNVLRLGIDPGGRDGTRCFIERSWQISTSSHSTVPPPTRTVKTCPLGVMDPRPTWGVMCGPSTVRDGTRDSDGTEVAYRLPAKPVGSSEVTRTVGQVDPAGQQKVDPPGRVPTFNIRGALESGPTAR